jgi:hypothetical protein
MCTFTIEDLHLRVLCKTKIYYPSKILISSQPRNKKNIIYNLVFLLNGFFSSKIGQWREQTIEYDNQDTIYHKMISLTFSRLKAVFSDYRWNYQNPKWSNSNTVLSHWRSRQKKLPVHSEKLVSVHRLKRQTHQIVSKRFSSRMCIQNPSH